MARKKATKMDATEAPPASRAITPTQMKLGPEVLQMIDEIMKETGASTRSETVRQLIHRVHRETFGRPDPPPKRIPKKRGTGG